MRPSGAVLIAAFLIVLSGCGNAPPQSLESTQILYMQQQITRITEENNKFAARIRDLETAKDKAESVVVRLVFLLVGLIIILALIFHNKMLLLMNMLYAKWWGRCAVWVGCIAYFLYDVYVNGSQIKNWLLK